MTLYTLNAPSSGPILAFILRIIDGLVPASSELLNTQRITEAMKFGFGARSRLGDPRFVDIRKVSTQESIRACNVHSNVFIFFWFSNVTDNGSHHL